MSIKHRITELRREKGMTQRALADRIGATESMVGKLERGEREMTFSWLTRIASVLEVPTGDLLDATDEPVTVGQVTSDGRVHHQDAPAIWNVPEGSPTEVFAIKKVSEHKIGLELLDDVNVHLPAGSLLVYEGPHRRPTRDLAGRLVVALTTDQPLNEPQPLVERVGVLMPGSDTRRYHIIPFSGPPATDVLVHWVFLITEVRI